MYTQPYIPTSEEARRIHTYTGPLPKLSVEAGVLLEPMEPQPPEGAEARKHRWSPSGFAWFVPDDRGWVLWGPIKLHTYKPGDVVEFEWRTHSGYLRAERRRIVSVEPVDVVAWLPVPAVPAFDFGIPPELRKAHIDDNPGKPWAWACQLGEM